MEYLSTAPYEAQIDNLTRLFNTNKKNLQDDNARALREMYVGRMMAERDLPNRLSAYGMHGGLTETSEMDLRNTYGRNRANQEFGYQRNLADLTNTYQGNIGQLRAQIAAIQARMAAEEAARVGAGRGTAAAARVSAAQKTPVSSYLTPYGTVYRYSDGTESYAADPARSAASDAKNKQYIYR